MTDLRVSTHLAPMLTATTSDTSPFSFSRTGFLQRNLAEGVHRLLDASHFDAALPHRAEAGTGES